ncbi:MAG: T9SS type A sorting domain-containing protein [Flavobacteriales bacterium]|nr:MAG: T9SS type A sorting domain-containing protein [Flavobacteriales bacterium]
MKKNIQKLLLGCSLALATIGVQAQGLEQIIVEQYYEASAADAAASEFGSTDGIAELVAGSRTYRIYADLLPGYKLETVFGNTDHPLNIGTTTFFYNQTDRGTALGHTNATGRLDENTCSIDSYLTFGMAGSTKRGVLKSADANATGVIFPNSEGSPVMENQTAWMGTALTTADGLATGAQITTQTIGISDLSAFTGNATGTFSTNNGAWFVLGGAQGEDPNGTNRILIAQITTSGSLSFNLNMRVSPLAGGSFTDYVSSNPTGAEVTIPSLNFPLAVDCNGVPGGPALPGTPCDDNDACTVNDVYTGTAPNCGCAGTFADADSDGTCDANDVCPGGPEPGTPCDDLNAATTGDVIQANCTCAGTLICTPGAPCNDNNACTTGEVFDANCNCGGGVAVDPDDNNPCTLDSCDPINGVSNIFQDADGDGTCDANDLCPGGPEPGTACNDNDACTTNDVIGVNCQCAGTFADADGDGTCDANDQCPGGPEPGTPCDDGNAATTGDVIQANCQCVGVLGCTPGAPCNDFNACTTGEVFDANCNCGGGAAVDPNDNDPCTLDSCDPITGVSNIFQDADNDGTCDANDLCPGGPEPGTACDDGNPATNTDVIQANCTCAGVLGCTVGAPCDDLNACTTGEVFDANCNCGGGTAVDPDDNDPCTLDSCDPINGVSNIFQDADNDGTCDFNDVCPGGPEPGSACNDNDPCTVNDVVDANCNCAGTFADADNDGTCDANDLCANGPEPGTACDDGDINTINDTIGANCQCAGFNPNCTEDLVLTIELDAFGSQTTWEVRDQVTTAVVASGGPYTDGAPSTVLENLCLAVGCYQLNVFDANGDGISAGGYVLTDDIGRRIVDADGQFSNTSSIVAGAEPDFCLPVTGTFVKANWCDRTNLVPSSFIYAQGVAGATGYQFWFFDPHGSYSRRILKPTTVCQLNWATQPIPTGLELNVRVRALVGGNYQPFGKACTMLVQNPGGASFRDMTSFDTDGAHLSMYPNPNRDEVLYLMIEGLSDEATAAQVEIFDAMGKRIASEQLSVAAGTLNHAMTLSNEMEAGLYFVHVVVDGQTFTERLVRQ